MPASSTSAVPQDFGSPFLDGLEQRDVESILRAATKLKFPAKSTMSVQGDPAKHFFLMLDGDARYFYTTPEGKKILGPRILPGEIFGGAVFSLRPSPTYLTSTETVKDSSVVAWERSTIRALGVRHPRLLENMLSIAFDLIEWAVSAQIGLACHSARVRMAMALVDLARDVGHRSAAGVEFEVTNEDLANSANVTVFTASRLLSEWHRCGALVKSRGKVRLRSPEQLFFRRA
jgi:CRP-like cAMP-binding protein